MLLGSIMALGQTPSITSITPVATYPGSKVLITGSGFSSNPAQLKVWFDGVQGTITLSTTLSIEVTMPPQARLGNVEVLNTVSGLSGKSSLKAVPTFGGGDFDPLAVAAPLSFGSTREVFDVCSCDFDVDGKMDLIGSIGGPQTAVLSPWDLPVLRNTSSIGSLSFSTSTVAMTFQSTNLTCGDLDGDGKPDLIGTRGAPTTDQVFFARNTGSAGSISFGTITSLDIDPAATPTRSAFRVVAKDLNADGKPELIVSNREVSTNNLLLVFVNQSTVGAISFASTPITVTVTAATSSYGLDVQDMDSDGKPDIIINPFTGANLFILRNTSSGTISFAASQQITLGPALSPQLIEVTTADFNEDGKLDIAATSGLTDDKVYVLLNQSSAGSFSFANAMVLSPGDDPWGVNASDVDGDGDVDIVVGTQGLSVTTLTVLKSNGNNGSLAFAPVTVSTGKRSRNIRVGDLDGDAKPDFAYVTVTGNSIDIIRNKNCYVPTILNATPLTICGGQTIRLNAAPGFGVATYDWKESGSTVSSGANAFYDATVAGSYTVVATSESGTCVKTSNTIVINSGSGTLPADPVISSNSPLCNVAGQNLQLNGPTVAGVTYHWTGPNGFTSAAEDPQILNVTTANAGIYSLQVSNGTCFSNAATTLVDVANLASFTVSSSVPSNTICQGSNLNLTVNSQSGYTYQWIKDGVDIGGQTATTLAVTQQGAYTVRVTNTSLGCSLVTSPATNVVVFTAPVANFTVNATGCINDVLTFTDASTKDGAATAVYAWDFGDAGTSTSASPTHAYTTANTFNPSLTLSYSGVTGCTSNSAKSIVISDLPVVTINPPTPSITAGGSIQLVASVPAGTATYAWSPPDGLSSTTIENPVASPTASTTYTATGTLNGCSGTATVTVTVTGSPGATMNIPNVFTPNGDGANDEWVVPTSEGTCVVTVFDPSGRRVFEGEGTPVIWNGNFNGTPAPPGTYYYVVTCPSGGTVTGNFLLAR